MSDESRPVDATAPEFFYDLKSVSSGEEDLFARISAETDWRKSIVLRSLWAKQSEPGVVSGSEWLNIPGPNDSDVEQFRAGEPPALPEQYDVEFSLQQESTRRVLCKYA